MIMIENQILHGLNEPQIQAVTHTEGPLLVVAGPGTGKTLTITRRIAYILGKGVKPENILAITFTNRAAREMRERTEAYTGQAGRSLFIGTFHAFGIDMIRGTSNKTYRIIGRDDQIEILKNLTGGTTRDALKILDTISRNKNLLDRREMGYSDIFKRYEATLKDMDALDLDDLILMAVELLRDRERIGAYAGRFKYIMIDEYQDINPSQYMLIKHLSGFTANICAVGDSDQAIYSFRGADVENFLNFKKEFCGAKTVVLRENYRSSKIIVDASQSLIRNNVKRIEKDIYAVASKDDMSIKVIAAADEVAEASAIAREIGKRMGAMSHFQLMQAEESFDYRGGSYRFSDFAILYRTNSQAGALRDALTEAGIPFKVVGDDKNNRALRDIEKRLVGYLHNGWGDLTLEKILEDAFVPAGEDDLGGLRKNLLLAYMGLPVAQALQKIIDELSLFSSSDAYDPTVDTVTLMTLHMSKGLEFRVVFIAGVVDGIIPYGEPDRNNNDIEEERRLFYVGITRAKEELCITYCHNRSSYGRQKQSMPSLFIKEIPRGYIEYIELPRKDKNRKKPRQQRLF